MQIKHMFHYSTPAHIASCRYDLSISIIGYELCRQYSVAHLTLINHDIQGTLCIHYHKISFSLNLPTEVSQRHRNVY
jgi:hypothetical protein